jgi:diadenosine tetraphosphate (Ap4A) HIT family hydrolase
MQYDENNIFRKIIDKKITTELILESEHAASFFDINKKAKIHALVIPKGYYIDFTNFNNNASIEERIDFWNHVNQVIQELNITNGYRLVSNSGEDGSQCVFHFHVHILAGEKIK